MQALEGHRAHLAHIQFHSYGGDDEASLHSQAPTLAEYVNSHPNLSLDVGQVLFGPTTTMTGDGPVGYLLHQIYGGKWYSADIEQESGCGVVPIQYKRQSLIHGWQWAIGLEWHLLVANPWQIAMSTDHPNGGSFMAYPEIIRLLMDRDYRRDRMREVHHEIQAASVLRELDREYSLYEICIITRAAPARMLGLTTKGHLGTGADADITVYDPSADVAQMFSIPKYVLKSGHIVIEDGELREPPSGDTLHVVPTYDRSIEPHLSSWFDKHYSVRFRNYSIDDDEVDRLRRCECV
jgi:formylmethanofuran dehydrogenase subunit A